MSIEKNKVVSFNYTLRENDKVLESSQDDSPMLALIGYNNLIPGLESALLGKQQGESFTVSVPPEDAYGQRIEREPMRVPIKHLLGKPKKIRKGQIVHVNTKEGQRSAVAVKIGKFNVDIDTNHPFAGKTLDFDIEIVEVRDATPEEVEHRHAHGVGGHQH